MSLEQSSSQQNISSSCEKVQTEVKERGEALSQSLDTKGIRDRINESGKTEVAGWLEQAQTGLEGDVVMDLTPGD